MDLIWTKSARRQKHRKQIEHKNSHRIKDWIVANAQIKLMLSGDLPVKNEEKTSSIDPNSLPKICGHLTVSIILSCLQYVSLMRLKRKYYNHNCKMLLFCWAGAVQDVLLSINYVFVCTHHLILLYKHCQRHNIRCQHSQISKIQIWIKNILTHWQHIFILYVCIQHVYVC